MLYTSLTAIRCEAKLAEARRHPVGTQHDWLRASRWIGWVCGENVWRRLRGSRREEAINTANQQVHIPVSPRTAILLR
jgi:hypothetical protein